LLIDIHLIEFRCGPIPLAQQDGMAVQEHRCAAATDIEGAIAMTKSLTRTFDRAALGLVFALAALPIIGLPLLAIAAAGVIQ